MGYTPNLNDPNSPYYYGMDSTYQVKPEKSKPKPAARPVVSSPLLANDPELMSQEQFNQTYMSPGPTTAELIANDPELMSQEQFDATYGTRTFRPTQPAAPKPKPKPQSSTGREETRTSPTGVQQTGTQTSPRQMTMDDANRLLTGGYSVMNPFASNRLPASATDLYGTNGYQSIPADQIPENIYNEVPKTLGKNLDMDLGPFDLSNAPEYPVAGMEIQSEMLRGSPNIVQGGAAETAVTTTSATDSAKPSIPKRPRGERAGEMWDRKYGRMDQSTTKSETKGSGIDYARRSAFLDAPGTMQGLRRVEAQKGIVVAGGTYNMVNPNRGQDGENDFIQISKEDRDSYMRGDQGAQDLKSKYVDKITAANAGQDASAMTPVDTLQETDIAFESPAPANPMKTALEEAPAYQEAPEGYSNNGVQIQTKGKKFGF